MEPFVVEEASSPTGARIIAVGVGGGGGNMIGHMIKEGVTGIEMVVANTDAQALVGSNAPTKIQIGAKLTKGLGAGMKPEVGRESAIESFEEIRDVLDGADIVFIGTGLGGGTGTGAAPIIAKIAKEVGALTICVVTKPFKFEGRKRTKLAEAGLEELKEECDSIVVIPNEKLLSIIDRRLGMKDSFKMIDAVLAQAVSGTAGVILLSGDNDINLDFSDLKTVMSHKGLALMGTGDFSGENAAYEAVKMAIESPLLDNLSINGAMGVLVHFHMNPNFPMLEIGEAMSIIEDNADEDADVIFGTTSDDSIAIDQIKVTLVATGFEKEEKASVNNDDFVSKEPVKKVISRPSLLASNGDITDGDYLDIPTYMRNQKD